MWFVLIVVLPTLDFSCGLSVSDYLKIREKAIKDEEASSFGANLKLNKHEVIANQCLMSIKQREIDEGYKNLSTFWPAKDFFEVRKDIEQTDTFKILRLMPKGAVLHTHIGKTASLEFVYENLTTLPNLYVCLENNTVRFRFFDTPDKNCDWHLMSDLWENHPETINYIKKHLTLPSFSTSMVDPDENWLKFEEMGMAFDGIITYRPAYKKYIYRSLEELYEDNVMYAEMRTFAYKLYELNGTIYDPLKTFKIFESVIKEFVTTHPGFLGAKCIYNIPRQLDHEAFREEAESFRRIKRLLPEIVIGLDISNNENRGHPNLYFMDILLELSSETSFYFHAGETLWFGHPVDENLFDAILLNSKRIGHGFALIKHPNLLKMVKERDIAIELNPLSGRGYYKDRRTHPASHYFAKNLSIVVANDDPSYWEAKGLSYDFYEAFIGIMSRKADLRALKQLAINSINYSAMTKKEKKVAFEIWNKSWMKFIKYLAYDYKCGPK